MQVPNLKPLFGRPGPPGLKCTSAAAPTLQQTVACGLWGFNNLSFYLEITLCSSRKKKSHLQFFILNIS